MTWRSASEATLIKSAGRRDWGAFEELVERYHSHIFALALHALQNPVAAEQALQATFAAAWERLPAYHGRSPFTSWLAGLCAREVTRLLPRAAGPTQPDASRAVTTISKATGRGGRWRPRELRLRVAIATTVASLPASQRVSFVLGKLGGVSPKDIASALGVDPPVVRRHIHEAVLSVVEGINAWCHAPSWRGPDPFASSPQ